MADAGSHLPTDPDSGSCAQFVEAEQVTPASRLTIAELALIDRLERRFRQARAGLIDARAKRQARFDEGAVPSLRTDTRSIRDGDWQVASIPDLVADRRVEITGPVERKMIVNALNSNARVFMADFEDSTSPSAARIFDGHRHIREAVFGEIDFVDERGKNYCLKNPEAQAVLMVRPRGLHLPERHVEVDGEPASALIVDCALFLSRCGAELLRQSRGPFLYLPKLEAMEEAGFCDELLGAIESELDLPANCCRVTVLIETLPAAFEMDEILHALRHRVLGLNCGRWDYIFSTIKTLRAHRERLYPERSQISMDEPFLAAYAKRLIDCCHRRGAYAMGGMAAQIPIRGDEAANRVALAKVAADKKREAQLGHDGTWVAHPGLIGLAREAFDEIMPGPNQFGRRHPGLAKDAGDLLTAPNGTISRAGLANAITVTLRYVAAWLDGQGCVPIDHLMEDAATAEIARTQLWHWCHHPDARVDDGTAIDQALVAAAIKDELAALHSSAAELPGGEHLDRAAQWLEAAIAAPWPSDFLTLDLYSHLP